MPESGAPRVRSLADELRSWDVEGLTRLLDERPDLLNPVPADLRDLALRAGSAHSVGLCLDRLTGTELVALEVLAAHEEPVTHEQLISALKVSPDTADNLLARFRALALTWGHPAAHLVRAVADTFGPHPCHLMPPLAHTRSSLRKFAEEPTAVITIVSTLSTAAQELLTQVAVAGPLLDHPDASRLSQDTRVTNPAAELVQAGLLIAIDERTLAVPREVALPLRTGPWAQTRIPALNAAPTDLHLLELACDQATRSVTQVRALISALTHQPIKFGRGLTPHKPDIARISEHLGWTVEHTKVVISVAVAAELVGVSEHPQDCLTVTAASVSWQTLDLATQWLALCTAWRQRPDLVVTSVTRDSLDSHGYPSAALETAGAAVAAWMSIASDGGSTEAQTFVDMYPRLARRAGDEFAVVGVISNWLGLSASGWLSPLGRALEARDDGEAVQLLTSSFGPVIDFFYLQPDHTVIVPGRLAQEVRQRLLLFSIIESDDRALVTRITPMSLRRGLEAGEAPDKILDFLRNHSHTGVPQSLEYQISDLTRRPRNVEITPNACVLQFGDTHMRTEAVKALHGQGISVAEHGDQTLTTREPVKKVLDALAAAGFAIEGSAIAAHAGTPAHVASKALWLDPPSSVSAKAIASVLVSADRQINHNADGERLKPTPTRERTAGAAGTHPDRLTDAATARSHGDEQSGVVVRSDVDTTPPLLELATRELIESLSKASETGQSVTIEYASRSGAREIVQATPLHVDHGFVTVFDLARQQVRTLTLSRVARLAVEF